METTDGTVLVTGATGSYCIGLVTPVKPSIAMPLIEGVRNEMICRDLRIRELIPIPLTGFDESIRSTLTEEKNLLEK
jgi:hypothetical protein